MDSTSLLPPGSNITFTTRLPLMMPLPLQSPLLLPHLFSIHPFLTMPFLLQYPCISHCHLSPILSWAISYGQLPIISYFPPCRLHPSPCSLYISVPDLINHLVLCGSGSYSISVCIYIIIYLSRCQRGSPMRSPIRSHIPQVQPRCWFLEANHFSSFLFSVNATNFWPWHGVVIWMQPIQLLFKFCFQLCLLILKIDLCLRLLEGKSSIDKFKQSTLTFVCIVRFW